MSYLDNLNPIAKQDAYIKLGDAIVQVLKDNGPLTFKGLHHFTKIFFDKEYDIWLSENDLKYAISVTRSRGLITDPVFTKSSEKSGNSLYYKLAESPEEDLRTPSYDNYVEAYYKLWEHFQFVRQNPEWLNAPEEWLKVFLTDMETN